MDTRSIQIRANKTKYPLLTHGVLVQCFVSGQTCCVSSDNGE